jgi:single-strand DNA-binding protein
MPHHNKFTVIGNLTRDPELKTIKREAKEDLSICNFAIASNKPGEDKKPLFIETTVFGKTAEACSKYLSKGSLVFAEGELAYDSWEDQETKKKMSKISLIADSIQFLDPKDSDEK